MGRVHRLDRASRKINWTNVGAFAVFHLGAIAALFTFSWLAFAAAIFLFWMCTGLGISMGYHRLHTHRSYEVPLGLEYFFAVCGALTLEGGPIFMGGDSPDASSEVGPTGRPSFPTRWWLVGAHGLASGWA
jgi:fatty-acid desaturase